MRRAPRSVRRALPVLALSLALALAPGAHAAADSEAAPRRDGFAIGFAIGPAIFRGAGELDAKQGVGADFNLRVGTSASPDLLWQLELQGGGYPVDRTTSTGTERIYNAHATLTLGGQIYVRETLWLRAGAGVAEFLEQEGENGPERAGTRRDGWAVVGGGGYDLFRRGIFAVDLEVVISGALLEGAFFAHSSLLLGLIWY